jgi:hypothetical protein
MESSKSAKSGPSDRDEIDAMFAAMANDEEYLEDVRTLQAEFALADWEAFRLGEDDSSP